MTAQAVITKLQWVPSYVGRWSTEPMGRRLHGWFRSIWRRKTKEAFWATCSLQLPWELQERTQSGSSHSQTLKAQEILAAPRAGLYFSSFSQEKNFVLFYNFLEIAVISEKTQKKIMKVFYSLKHKITHSLNLKNWTWNSQEGTHIISHFGFRFQSFFCASFSYEMTRGILCFLDLKSHSSESIHPSGTASQIATWRISAGILLNVSKSFHISYNPDYPWSMRSGYRFINPLLG